jgi:beta-N-acetylhexosaminidase
MRGKKNRYQYKMKVLLLILAVSLCAGGILLAIHKTGRQDAEQNPVLTEGSSAAANQEVDSVINDDLKTDKQNYDAESENIEAAKDAEASDEQIDSAQAALLAEEEKRNAEVTELLDKMTLEQKIYQMFIVTPEQLTGIATVTAAGEQTKNSLAQQPVGGLVYFAQNCVSPDQLTEMLGNTMEFANEIEGVPLFLCIDEEGGRVARIANQSNFGEENVGPMSDIDTVEAAYQAGETIGAYLSRYGFNVDFAPDADVLTNADNTVIGDRSFGSDAERVLTFAASYSDGLHAAGVLSTFKHYPGHGATEADSHEGYAYTNKTYEELCEAELKPFAAAQEAQVNFIMAAHISLPNVIGDETPCSLSYRMITQDLRESLNYEGIIITDALNMGAISEKYTSSEAAVKAVEAGVDMLLMPVNLQAAYDGIYDAVMSGEITEERIDESVRRILYQKVQFHS